MTEPIKWHEKYSVGCQMIDIQHKRLFELTNKLYEALHNEKNKKIIEYTILQMKYYSVYHFITEELLFEKYDYPLKNEHINEHQKFIDKVNDFMERYKTEKDIGFEILQFLKEWIIEHVIASDSKYTECICNKD